MLCADFCGDKCLLHGGYGGSESELSDDLRFRGLHFWDLRKSTGSGEGESGGVIGGVCVGMAIASSLDSSSGLSGAKGPPFRTRQSSLGRSQEGGVE